MIDQKVQGKGCGGYLLLFEINLLTKCPTDDEYEK